MTKTILCLGGQTNNVRVLGDLDALELAGDEECPCMDKLILLSPVIDPILTRVSDSDQTPSIIHKPLLHVESEGICETIGGQPIVPE